MGNQKTNEELRAEVDAMDASKDVPIVAGVTLAVVAGVSAGAGVLACLAIGFLESFRADVTAYWMGCVPLIFPFITGVAAAYRKQLANIGLHIALCVTTLLSGGAGYGYSVENVYKNRHNCTPVDVQTRGSCDKEGLVYLYVIAGGVACGFAVLGLLISFCTCSISMKRRDKRIYEQHLREEREADKKNKEVKQIQSRPRPSVVASHANKPQNGQENGGSHNAKAPLDATTHL